MMMSAEWLYRPIFQLDIVRDICLCLLIEVERDLEVVPTRTKDVSAGAMQERTKNRLTSEFGSEQAQHMRARSSYGRWARGRPRGRAPRWPPCSRARCRTERAGHVMSAGDGGTGESEGEGAQSGLELVEAALELVLGRARLRFEQRCEDARRQGFECSR